MSLLKALVALLNPVCHERGNRCSTFEGIVFSKTGFCRLERECSCTLSCDDD